MPPGWDAPEESEDIHSGVETKGGVESSAQRSARWKGFRGSVALAQLPPSDLQRPLLS